MPCSPPGTGFPAAGAARACPSRLGAAGSHGVLAAPTDPSRCSEHPFPHVTRELPAPVSFVRALATPAPPQHE